MTCSNDTITDSDSGRQDHFSVDFAGHKKQGNTNNSLSATFENGNINGKDKISQFYISLDTPIALFPVLNNVYDPFSRRYFPTIDETYPLFYNSIGEINYRLLRLYSAYSITLDRSYLRSIALSPSKVFSIDSRNDDPIERMIKTKKYEFRAVKTF